MNEEQFLLIFSKTGKISIDKVDEKDMIPTILNIHDYKNDSESWAYVSTFDRDGTWTGIEAVVFPDLNLEPMDENTWNIIEGILFEDTNQVEKVESLVGYSITIEE